LKSGEIKAEMAERGWLGSEEVDQKRFYSSLSKMSERGHVLRLADRRYMLPQEAAGGP